MQLLRIIFQLIKYATMLIVGSIGLILLVYDARQPLAVQIDALQTPLIKGIPSYQFALMCLVLTFIFRIDKCGIIIRDFSLAIRWALTYGTNKSDPLHDPADDIN